MNDGFYGILVQNKIDLCLSSFQGRILNDKFDDVYSPIVHSYTREKM